MNEKRRDNKGRILRNGEIQRTDGKYEFKYKDINGKRKSIYSWRLVDTDKLPSGKRKCEPLRNMEKDLAKDVNDGIDYSSARKMSLNEYYADYINTKSELKSTTLASYRYMYDRFVKYDIGLMKLTDIKYSEVKKFYLKLVDKMNLSPSTVGVIHTLLHPIFNVAVRDNILRSNPSDGVLSEIKRGRNWHVQKKHVLTVQQQERFLNFIRNSKYNKWDTLFTVMFGTGARIGEICALRWDDCDFDKNIIEINHNLVYDSMREHKKSKLIITTPKTISGVRIIPMFSNVKQTLLNEYNKQRAFGFNELTIDGYKGFIFSGRSGGALRGSTVNGVILRAVDDMNKYEKANATDPILLPNFSCHDIRHTFCTRLCENGVNIKVIQEIMGHKSITTTMDIYSEATMQSKIDAFANIDHAFTTNFTTIK